jgi:nucleoside phosphorylase
LYSRNNIQMGEYSRPSERNEFHIAIICALPIESDAVEALFDEFWEEDDTYGKAAGDSNSYTTGRIGRHNVVLAFMPGMGKAHSASVTGSFRSSFGNIRLGLVVGICGGVPRGTEYDEEVLLGDVIISTGLVQYDFGRQFPNKIIRKDTLQDNVSRPNTEIRGFLAKMKGRRALAQLKDNTSVYLADLYQKDRFKQWGYPGVNEDKLYEASYRHKHHDITTCTICARCESKEDAVCDMALDSSCELLKCSDDRQVFRNRLEQAKQTGSAAPTPAHAEAAEAPKPEIHFGLIASGDSVMKSGYHRDEIAAKEKIIAFEMEGAGVWDSFPTVVIKGVCDYADSHKNKKWQRYAAATAAACMKAFLKEWRVADAPYQAASGFDKTTKARGRNSESGSDHSEQAEQVQHFSGSFSASKAFIGSKFDSRGGAMYF